jgi:hypothetical protein
MLGGDDVSRGAPARGGDDVSRGAPARGGDDVSRGAPARGGDDVSRGALIVLVLHHAMKQIIRSYVLMIRAEIGTLLSEGSERCVQNVAERAAVTFRVAGSPWPDDTHI